jgi:hypothetical protein
MAGHVVRMMEERYLQGFGGETWKKEKTWDTQAQMGGWY